MSERNLFGRLRDAAAEIMGRTPTTYLTSLPAPTDGDYPLRKRQEDRLYRALCRRGAAIMLHGPGGMGKTHMARSLFYRMSRKYKRLAWVEYGVDLRTALTPVPREGVTENPDVRFARFIEELREAPRDTILFIDDAKEWAAEDPVLAQITGMGVTVFLTSRCPRIASYEGWALEPVTVSECVELFYANYRGDRERKYRDTVEELVRRLDRNVFAVLLLARVTGEGENLPRIAQRLTGGGLMDHIGQLIACSRLTAEQQQLLRCLALTNSGELLEDLVDWMDFQDSDVQALVEGGWLLRNEKTECLVLHDLVREYYNRETPGRQTVVRFIKGALGEDFCRRTKAHASSDFKGKALDFQLRALEIMEQHWDSREKLAVASNNVGLALSEYGDYRRSLEYLNKALSIRERVLPPDHPDLALSYNNVGATYSYLGDHAKALEFQLKDLEICKKVLPPDHPDLAVSYNNVGTTYGDLGDHAKALEFKLKALEIFEKVLPSDHPDLAASYNNVGYTYGYLGDHAKALEYLLKALEIREKVLSPDHPDLAQSYNNVGTGYDELGDHAKALEYKLKSLEIREKVLPPDHPDLALSYNNMGYSYGKLGDREKKLEYYRKALSIQERTLPRNHPDIASSCNNIAVSYAEEEQYAEALQWMHRALEIAEHSLPEDHPDRRAYREGVKDLEGRCAED